MAELELVGLHADGEHLVLVGPGGHRHRLVIDEALRSAIGQDRPRSDRVAGVPAGDLRPRDIQTRLRAGESPEEIAEGAGVSVEKVRRYEGPVLAEQTWVAQQARALPLGRDSDAPVLGDLVVDRLAGRDVQPGDLAWTAVRRPGEAWELVLRFSAGGRVREARWTVDLTSRSLHAMDDESRWLSETDLGAAEARRHLAAVGRGPDGGGAGAAVYDVEVDVGPSAVPAVALREPAVALRDADPRTVDLLEGLRASRGVRPEVSPPPDEAGDEDGPWFEAPPFEPPPAHPAASAPHEWPDASVLPLPTRSSEEGTATRPSKEDTARRTAEDESTAGEQGAGGPTPEEEPASVDGPTTRDEDPGRTPPAPGRRPKSRSRRTSVPSWDEIVFGAKQE